MNFHQTLRFLLVFWFNLLVITIIVGNITMTKLDAIDCRIVRELQTDAKQTNQVLADKVGLSQTPYLRRVKRLEESGIIKAYKAEIDRLKLGLTLTVIVQVKVERHQDAEAADFVKTVMTWPEVINCHLVSGGMDFLLEVVVQDMAAYEKFVLQRLLNINSVKDLHSNFVMRTYKSQGILPIIAT